jgi:hypothetical protein
LNQATITITQKSHALNRGNVSMPKFNSAVLHRKICVDGQIVSVYGANDEQFDMHVHAVLNLMYRNKKKMIDVYNTDLYMDYSDRNNRVIALNELDGLNKMRKKNGKVEIALFADEV